MQNHPVSGHGQHAFWHNLAVLVGVTYRATLCSIPRQEPRRLYNFEDVVNLVHNGGWKHQPISFVPLVSFVVRLFSKGDTVHDKTLSGWALILGASSGFGAACSRALAAAGMDIVGVHLDSKAGLSRVEAVTAAVEAAGQRALFFNINAADDDKRRQVLDTLQAELGERRVKLMLHSLAFGSLKPLVADTPADSLTRAQIEMTLDVMAHSLVYWTQDLVWRNLLADDARIYAMTSAGSHRAFTRPTAPWGRPKRPWRATSATWPWSWRRATSRSTPSRPASPTPRPCARSPATRQRCAWP